MYDQILRSQGGQAILEGFPAYNDSSMSFDPFHHTRMRTREVAEELQRYGIKEGRISKRTKKPLAPIDYYIGLEDHIEGALASLASNFKGLVQGISKADNAEGPQKPYLRQFIDLLTDPRYSSISKLGISGLSGILGCLHHAPGATNPGIVSYLRKPNHNLIKELSGGGDLNSRYDLPGIFNRVIQIERHLTKR